MTPESQSRRFTEQRAVDARGTAWTVEGHIHHKDLLEHGYQGITSVSNATDTWTTVVEPLEAVISVRFSRSYKRRAIDQKN
jgi:hypothetical protein